MRFLLVDAVNDEIINDFGNGTTFSLAELSEFNIVAEPETENVQSVVFELNGSEFSVDGTAPFSLGGDNQGDFQALSLEPGEYTLVATPFVLSANGDTVAQTPFEVTFTIVDGENTETELNIEAEAEAEAESEAEAEVEDGIAAGAVAQGAGAAAFGNNALAETTTSGSISLNSRLPAPRFSIAGSGSATSGVASLNEGDLLNAELTSEPSTDVSVISAEAEAEAEVESEVEAEITNGAASATGGSAASAAAVGTNILLFEDGSSRPAAADTETATDSTTSTSTSVSPVLLAFASKESDGGDTGTDGTETTSEIVDESAGESSQTATLAQVAKDKDEKDKFKQDKDKTLPVLVLDTEAEVEAEAEAEAEAESGAVTNSLTAAVVTAPGAAAAAVSGGTAVAVAGDFAVANAGSSVATSTSTSAVTEAEFDFASLDNSIASESFDEETNTEAKASESVADIEGAVAKSSADKGKDKDKDEKDKDDGSNVFGKGLFEAEAESEAEAEVEAEVGNNSAAVASIANGGGGATGLAATSQISSSTTASTSTQFDRGAQIRDNDVVDRDRNRFEGAVDFADNSIAQVETNAEAEANIGADKVPLTFAAANNFTLGDATAESTTTLDGSTSSIAGGETLGDTFIAGNTASPDKSKTKEVKGDKEDKSDASGDVVGAPDNLEIEIETEVDAEAEAEISFNSAAAGAAAVATQAENGFIPTPAEGTTATSSSTSVFNNGENRFDDKNAPGAAAAGGRGGVPVPNVSLADLVFEIETEAEAEAEVGFNAGAAAAAASVAGKQGLVPQTEIITTPFSAAAASGAAPIVELEIFAPPDKEAGEVFARVRAFDPEGGPVAAAVAVAGVPTEGGFDNEEEAEAEGLGEVIVEVSIMTDPADALNIAPLTDNESQDEEDGEPGGTSSIFESESEAESEAEAEAGYGVAAAAASAGGAGLFSDASAKSSTSTLPIISADSGETILGTSNEDELLGTDRGDFIAGLEASDKLTGNGGDDLFVYDRLEDGVDTITDFEVGSDKIVLTNLLARFDVTSPDPIADGFIDISGQKEGSLVSIDTDGAGEATARSLVLVENVSVDELSSLTNFAV